MKVLYKKNNVSVLEKSRRPDIIDLYFDQNLLVTFKPLNYETSLNRMYKGSWDLFVKKNLRQLDQECYSKIKVYKKKIEQMLIKQNHSRIALDNLKSS